MGLSIMPANRHIVVNGRFLTQTITGVQRYALELIRHWDQWIGEGLLDTHQASIEILHPKGELAIDPQLRHIRVRAVGRSSGQVWEQVELPSHVKGRLLFCPCNSAPIRYLMSGKPAVVTVHSLAYRRFPEAYSGAFRLWYDIMMPVVMKRATSLLTVSLCERRTLLADFPECEDRLHVVQNGARFYVLDNGDLPTSPLIPTDPYVLYVGSLTRLKNLQALFDAFAMIHRDQKKLRLVIAGGAAGIFPADQWKIPAGVSGKVEFVGQIDDAAILSRLYKGASLFVFPSMYESSSLPPMEAMAHGCPVIASSIPIHHERLGDAALYADPARPEEFARQMKRVLDDAGISSRLRAKGPKRAAEFTWDRCARETLSLLLETTAPLRKRRAA